MQYGEKGFLLSSAISVGVLMKCIQTKVPIDLRLNLSKEYIHPEITVGKDVALGYLKNAKTLQTDIDSIVMGGYKTRLCIYALFRHFDRLSEMYEGASDLTVPTPATSNSVWAQLVLEGQSAYDLFTKYIDHVPKITYLHEATCSTLYEAVLRQQAVTVKVIDDLFDMTQQCVPIVDLQVITSDLRKVIPESEVTTVIRLYVAYKSLDESNEITSDYMRRLLATSKIVDGLPLREFATRKYPVRFSFETIRALRTLTRIADKLHTVDKQPKCVTVQSQGVAIQTGASSRQPFTCRL